MHNFGNGFVLSSPLSNNNDIFIAKFGSNGTCIWAMQIGQQGNDRALSIALDENNYIYVVGQFSGTNVNFSPLESEPGHSSLFLDGVNRGFLVRYNGMTGQSTWRWQSNNTIDGYAATHVSTMTLYRNSAYQVGSLSVPTATAMPTQVYMRGEGGSHRQFDAVTGEEYYPNTPSGNSKVLELQSFVVQPKLIYGTDIGADEDTHKMGGAMCLIDAPSEGKRYLGRLSQTLSQDNANISLFTQWLEVENNASDFTFNQSTGEIFVVNKNTNPYNNGVSFGIKKYTSANSNANISLVPWQDVSVSGAVGSIVSPEDIKVTRSGTIYVVGYIQGVNINFGNGFVLSKPQVTNFLHNRSGFIAEYDNDGNCVNAKLLPITNPDGSYLGNINLSFNSSKLSIGGNFLGTANFNACGGTSNVSFSTPAFDANIFLAQHDQNFNQLRNLRIEGRRLYCSNSEEYEVDNIADATYTWTSSNNLSLQNANTSIVGTSPNGTVNGEAAWVECTISVNNNCFSGSRTIRKDIWIGKPENPVLLSSSPSQTPVPPPYILEFCAEKCEVYQSIRVRSKGAQVVGLFLNNQVVSSFKGETGELRIPLFYPAGQYTFQIVSANRCGLSNVINISITLKPKCGECLMGGRIVQTEVYPNPIQDIVRIKAQEGATFKLYDKLNQEILSGVIDKTQEKTINIKYLKSDIYFLHVFDDKQREVLKVVKQ